MSLVFQQIDTKHGGPAIYPLDTTCSGCHWTHPEDAVAFPLALVGVDCHSIETRHLGNRLAQQIGPQFTVYKNHHWRLVQLTVLKSHKEKKKKKKEQGEILFSHISHHFCISPCSYFSNCIQTELLRKASKELCYDSPARNTPEEKKYNKGVAGKLIKRSHSPVWLYFRICCNLKVFNSGCKLVSVTDESNFTHYPVWIDCRPCIPG